MSESLGPRENREDIIRALTQVAQVCRSLRGKISRSDRILRDAIFHWWETQNHKRHDERRRFSLAARQEANRKNLRLEHSIPLTVLCKRLLSEEVTYERMEIFLLNELHSVVITVDEDRKLLPWQSKVPDGESDYDQDARYRAADIAMEPLE